MRRTRFALAAVLVVVAGSTLASTAPSPGEGWLRWGTYGMSEETPAPIDGMLGRAASPSLPPAAVEQPGAPVIPAPALRPEAPLARSGARSVRLPEVTREGQVVVREARVSAPRASSLEGAKVRAAPSLLTPASRPAAAEGAPGPAGPAGSAGEGGPARLGGAVPGALASAQVPEGVVEMPQNSGKARGSSAGSKVRSFRGLASRTTRGTVNPDFPEMSATSKPVAAAIAASVKPTAKPAVKAAPKTVTTKAVATVVKRVS